MTPRRITWDMSLAGKNDSGVGIYSRELARCLGELQEWSLTLLNGWRFPLSQMRPIATLMSLVWLQTRCSTELRRLAVDLHHGPAFLLPPSPPCPAVVTVHDLAHLRFPEHYRRWWRRYLRGALARSVRDATVIVTISDFARTELLTSMPVDARKVYVVRPGVDHAEYFPRDVTTSRARLRRYGLPERFFLHVGALVSRKNLPLLLRAYAAARSGSPVFPAMVLVGKESRGMTGETDVRATVRSEGLERDILILSDVPDTDLPYLYSAAEAVVVASKYEGFGLPLLEAMACGTPVISSTAKALVEVAGDAACFVPVDDEKALAKALNELAERESLRHDLRAAGNVRAAEFSWQRTARELSTIYAGVLA